jgi:hypothetical protein
MYDGRDYKSRPYDRFLISCEANASYTCNRGGAIYNPVRHTYNPVQTTHIHTYCSLLVRPGD